MIGGRLGLVTLLFATLLLACTSSSLDSGVPSGAAADAATEAAPTDSFTELVARPLSRSCGSCHGEANPERGLVLDGVASAQLKLRLINAPSSETTSMKLITPGDPDNSYLVRKIKGTLTDVSCASSCGSKMPPGNAYPAKSLQDLEDWVEGGAR